MSQGIGIDIGEQTVKAVQVRVRGGEVQVLRWANVSRRSLGVEPGDADAAARAAAAHVVRRGFGRAAALAGLSDKEVIVRYVRAPAAAPAQLGEAMEREVAEATGADPRASACAFRQLELPHPSAGAALFVLALSRNQLLERRAAALAAGGLDVAGFCPDTLALFNAGRRVVGGDSAEDVVLLDVGAEKAEMAVLHGRRFAFARSVTPGGAEFTEAVAEALDVSLAQAEKTKCERGRIVSAAEAGRLRGTEAGLCGALLDTATQLSDAVASAVSLARAHTGHPEREPGCYYLSGGGARLAGLREHLASAFGRPVHTLALGPGLAEAEADAEQPSPFAVAFGLALAAADRSAFALRLLPERLRRARERRRRRAFGRAAACLALLAMAVALAGPLREWALGRGALAELEKRVAAAAELRGHAERHVRLLADARRKGILLADRARANALLLRGLDEVRRACPEAVTLTALTFDPGARPGSRPGRELARVAFHVKGHAAAPEGGDAFGELDALVRRLQALAGGPVRLTHDDPLDGKLEFDLTFSPSDSLLRREPRDAAGAGR